MKYLISFLLVFSFVFTFAQDTNQTDAKGRKQGFWQKTYPKGEIRYKGQ